MTGFMTQRSHGSDNYLGNVEGVTPCSVVEEGSNMVTYGLDPGVESERGDRHPAGH